MTRAVDLLPAEAIDANALLAMRLSGLSIRRLARHFGCTETTILRVLDEALPPLSNETRVRLYREDIARIDDLLIAFYPRAKQGDGPAAQIVLRLLERRALMTGTDAPQRLDVVVAQATGDAPEGSTEALIREIERIAAERGTPIIEHRPSEE
jgi:hypothetical protein